MGPAKTIGIVLAGAVGYSETFIKAHIDNLGTHVLYAPSFPRKSIGSPQKNNERLATLRKTYRWFMNQARGMRIKRLLQLHKPDMLLAEYGVTGVQILSICKKKKIPLAVHFHGYDAYRKDLLAEHAKDYQELFDYCCAIIVVSRDMERQIISLGGAAEKVFYNTYGVDIDKFKAADILHSPKQLIAVGRFVEKKAPYLTLLAFKKALEQVPDARLIMAGDGPLFEVCQQMIISLKLSENVFLHGAVTHAGVSSLMQQSRAFVQHSITALSGDSEGTPNTILEAQASGLPVISTRHAGIKDVVVHEKTGFLVDEGNVDEMAGYMVQILNDVELAAKVGIAARKHIIDNYLMKDSITKLRAILNNSFSN